MIINQKLLPFYRAVSLSFEWETKCVAGQFQDKRFATNSQSNNNFWVIPMTPVRKSQATKVSITVEYEKLNQNSKL